jgi:hypothetical protein
MFKTRTWTAVIVATSHKPFLFLRKNGTIIYALQFPALDQFSIYLLVSPYYDTQNYNN